MHRQSPYIRMRGIDHEVVLERGEARRNDQAGGATRGVPGIAQRATICMAGGGVEFPDRVARDARARESFGNVDSDHHHAWEKLRAVEVHEVLEQREGVGFRGVDGAVDRESLVIDAQRQAGRPCSPRCRISSTSRVPISVSAASIGLRPSSSG